MSPIREKRTRTQPGLGKVSATDDATGEARAPISAPPASGGAISAGARTTRSLGSSPPSEPGEAKADPRSETEPPVTGRVAREERVGRPYVDRTPIDVTHVDTKRLARPLTSNPFETRPKPARSAPSDESPSKPPSARGPEPRTHAGGFALAESPTGHHPIGASRPSSSPVVPPPKAPTPPAPAAAPARSKRMSIREDDLGSAVKRVSDAIGGSGRATPKLLKTKAEIAAAPIDHRAGFLLAHIDGLTTVQGLVDICGMSSEEVEQILDRLRRLGIVAVR